MFFVFPAGLDHEFRGRPIVGPALGAVLLYRYIAAFEYPQLTADMALIQKLWLQGEWLAAITRAVIGSVTPPAMPHLWVPLAVVLLLLIVLEDFVQRWVVPLVFFGGALATSMLVSSGTVVAAPSFHPVHGGLLALFGAGLAIGAATELKFFYAYLIIYGRFAVGSGVGGFPLLFLFVPAVAVIGVVTAPSNASLAQSSPVSIGMGMYSLIFPLLVAGVLFGIRTLWERRRNALPPTAKAADHEGVGQT